MGTFKPPRGVHAFNGTEHERHGVICVFVLYHEITAVLFFIPSHTFDFGLVVRLPCCDLFIFCLFERDLIAGEGLGDGRILGVSIDTSINIELPTLPRVFL